MQLLLFVPTVVRRQQVITDWQDTCLKLETGDDSDESFFNTIPTPVEALPQDDLAHLQGQRRNDLCELFQDLKRPHSSAERLSSVAAHVEQTHSGDSMPPSTLPPSTLPPSTLPPSSRSQTPATQLMQLPTPILTTPKQTSRKRVLSSAEPEKHPVKNPFDGLLGKHPATLDTRRAKRLKLEISDREEFEARQRELQHGLELSTGTTHAALGNLKEELQRFRKKVSTQSSISYKLLQAIQTVSESSLQSNNTLITKIDKSKAELIAEISKAKLESKAKVREITGLLKELKAELKTEVCNALQPLKAKLLDKAIPDIGQNRYLTRACPCQINCSQPKYKSKLLHAAFLYAIEFTRAIASDLTERQWTLYLSVILNSTQDI
ncbi:hypothetical protein CIB48_g478 [Xylaria polymorpha]|nr:hypothetical protein CIB48_g478 [Xylaria polymorpha]